MKKLIFILLIFTACDKLPLRNKNGFTTQSAILITLDGVRWEEVFNGADKRIIFSNINNKKMKQSVLDSFWVKNKSKRRKLLMPFLWGDVVSGGQIYGNKQKGSVMQLTNPYYISYPGYSELLTGFSDNNIKSNAKILNPNINILEYLNEKNGFKNRVAAFASWDVFDWIINNQRNQFTINSGAYPLREAPLSLKQEWLNNFVSYMPYEGYGKGVRWDALTYEYAFEYLKLNQPRFLYIAFDETDEFAHQKKYGEYLTMIKRLDSYISTIWKWVQSEEAYRNKTTLIITTDHGRGDHLQDRWGSHGSDIVGANYLWSAIIGPDTPFIGEVINSDTIKTNQIGPTIMHLLGHDFKSNKKVGPVIKSMINKPRSKKE